MKEFLKNFLSTTALTLIIISCFALVTGDTHVHLLSIFPSIAANLIVHLGLLAIKWFDIKNFIAEIAIEVTFVLASVLAVGFLVGWFRETEVWVTVVITLLVFAGACLINVRRVNHDLTGINEDIQLLKKKQQIHQPESR
jgi:FtsH-binding integral membrane protein